MTDLFGQAVDHRCLACGKVHAGATEVTLHDGTRASSYSEAWRHECEARAILSMSGVHRRQLHLDGIGKKRGAAVADKLRATMLALWEAHRNKSDVA